MIDDVWFNTNVPIVLTFPWLKITYQKEDYYPGLIRLRHRICHYHNSSLISGTKEHYHDVYHFIFCIEGCNSLIVDGEERFIKSGDYFIVNPGIPHNLNPQTPDYVRFYAFTYQYLSGIKELDWPWKRLIRHMTGSTVVEEGHTVLVDQWEEQFLLFLDRLNKPGTPNLSELGILFMDYIRSLFLTEYDERDLSLSYHTSPIKRVLLYIKDNYEKKLTIHDLGQVAHLSRGYLIELFKKEIGITPMDYLNKYRLDRACYLLSFTTLSNKEIAYKCGFSSNSYFSKIFKVFSGKTPRSYRSENKD